MNFSRFATQLGDLLDEETSALKAGRHDSLPDCNYRKSHLFLELTRALTPMTADATRDVRAKELFETLRAKLDANQKVLKLHLDAVTEVTEVLSRAIRDTESDGTYSDDHWASGGMR